MSTTIESLETITRVYEFFAMQAVRLFNELRKVMPQVVALSLGDNDEVHMTFIDPEMINALQQTPMHKQHLKTLVRMLLDHECPLAQEIVSAPAADAVVHITEVWMREDPDAEPSGEGIMVLVHTQSRTYFGLCPIDGAGDARIATFKPLRHDGNVVGPMAIHEHTYH